MPYFDDCRIRDIAVEDLAAVLEWRNDPEIRRYMLTQSVISPQEHLLWFERASRDPGKFLLIVEERGLPLGCVNFSNVTSGGTVDWGFYAVPNAAKGAGTKIGMTALDYAFGKLEVARVCGQALAGNAASISLHKRLGFRQESVLRNHCQIADTHHDLVCFGLAGQDWRLRRVELEKNESRQYDARH